MTHDNRLTRLVAVAICLLYSPISARAQDAPITWAVGGEIVSQYLWRGTVWSNEPNIEPYIELGYGSFALGTWGSYDFEGDYKEQDLYLTYSFEIGSTSASLTLNDYFYFQRTYFDYGGVVDGASTGTHFLEIVAEVSGPESFPLTFTLGWNFYNDPEDATWAAVSAERDLAGWTWAGSVGATLDDNFYYDFDNGNSAGDVIEMLFSASRTLFDGDRWAPYITGAVVYNPAQENTTWLFFLGL